MKEDLIRHMETKFKSSAVENGKLLKQWIHLVLLTFSLLNVNAQSSHGVMDSIIQDFMSENHIPGFVACVVKDSSILWSGSYGQADIRNNIAMSLDGIMNIGSISKTFTATATMQLWERGLIDLDTDINEYLDFEVRHPKFTDKPITILQILTHTSSIMDGKAYSLSYSCGDPIISLHDWIFHYLTPEGKYYDKDDNFADWSPGEKGNYSNVAFGLLGLIIEKVAQQPFNEYCKVHIFDPLGMKHTGWFLSEIDTNMHIKPYGYVTEENKHFIIESKRLYPGESQIKVGSFVQNCLYSFPNYPDGLIRTSVRELSYYLSAILNGGTLNNAKILNEETIDKMLSPQFEGNNSQGLCWYKIGFEFSSGPISLWGHSGGDPGISTFLLFNPEDRIGVITFQNNATGGTFNIVRELYQYQISKK